MKWVHIFRFVTAVNVSWVTSCQLSQNLFLTFEIFSRIGKQKLSHSNACTSPTKWFYVLSIKGLTVNWEEIFRNTFIRFSICKHIVLGGHTMDPFSELDDFLNGECINGHLNQEIGWFLLFLFDFRLERIHSVAISHWGNAKFHTQWFIELRLVDGQIEEES